MSPAAETRAPPAEEDDGPAEPDEADVLAALERRDRRTATALLMERHGEAVYRFCRQMTGDDALAADVHQVTFLQAFVDLETFSRRSRVRTWLFGIARHRCLDALKARRRWRHRFGSAVGDDEGGPIDSIDPAPRADARLGRQELIQALELCMDRLAPAVRTAVLLRFVEGFTYDEMARVCDEQASTLRTRVSRAMPVLRRCVEAHGGAIA